MGETTLPYYWGRAQIPKRHRWILGSWLLLVTYHYNWGKVQQGRWTQKSRILMHYLSVIRKYDRKERVIIHNAKTLKIPRDA